MKMEKFEKILLITSNYYRRKGRTTIQNHMEVVEMDAELSEMDVVEHTYLEKSLY